MGTKTGDPVALNALDFMDEIRIGDQTFLFYDLHLLDSKAGAQLARLPFSIKGMSQLAPHKEPQITARKADGSEVTFQAIARLDTDIDVEYMIHGGILPYVLRKLIKEA